MNEFPEAVENVSRDSVPTVVKTLLDDPTVGDVICRKQPDGDYIVTPYPNN